MAADALRLPPWDAKIGVLSGGEKRRVALCKLLLSKPDMLLLDEPTNHLDAESVEWLEQFLLRFPAPWWHHPRPLLPRQRRRVDPGTGPWPRHSMEGQLLVVAGAEGRPPEAGRSHRIGAPEGAARNWNGAPEPEGAPGQVEGPSGPLQRAERVRIPEAQRDPGDLHPVAERLGNEVIEFKNVSKGFGDRLLIDNLSFTIPPGAIVGIIGPNGAGKSTLFKMIAGKDQPDSGEVVIGKTAKISLVDQSRDKLADAKTVFEDVSGGADMLTVGRFEMPSRAYLGRFNFKGGDQQKIVGNLSGGERGRLHLAKTLLKGGNVLLLDEPSNDLDVETLRALEDALLEFAGSVMVISHDRWFLDRIATHILAFEGNSQVTFFDGNYQEYEADKKKRLGEEGAKPKRIRYKPLTN
jgi:sulfate-transporting ATPase